MGPALVGSDYLCHRLHANGPAAVKRPRARANKVLVFLAARPMRPSPSRLAGFSHRRLHSKNQPDCSAALPPRPLHSHPNLQGSLATWASPPPQPQLPGVFSDRQHSPSLNRVVAYLGARWEEILRPKRKTNLPRQVVCLVDWVRLRTRTRLRNPGVYCK